MIEAESLETESGANKQDRQSLDRRLRWKADLGEY